MPILTKQTRSGASRQHRNPLYCQYDSPRFLAQSELGVI